MKRFWTLLFLLLIFSIPASAQSDWRVSGGFTFNHVDYLPADVSSPRGSLGAEEEKMYGWLASVTQYTSLEWLGATVEVGGQYNTPTVTIPTDYFGYGVPGEYTQSDNVLHTSMYTAMVGPSFAYRGNPDLEPFAHVLLGGIYGKASLTSAGEALAGGALSTSDWVFGYAIGGGADFKISDRVGIRLQADWIRSAFPDGDEDRQNTFRASAGLVLHFPE